ncbi:MAG: hypothetical protein OWU33_15050 [Firmicutes bacterium]|nr:hypothetical protein [Bacillota bacterium]
METQDDKARLEEAFWQLLASRYPLTAWWWMDVPLSTDALFPDWSAAAIERETREWRRLAEETNAVAKDPETVHWGRFARHVVTRLEQERIPYAAYVLRHANMVLAVAELLDPREEQCARVHLLARLSEWLSTIEAVMGGTWHTAWAEAEAMKLVRLIHREGPQSCWVGKEWAFTRDQTTRQVHYFLDRMRDTREATREPSTWIPSAHVSVDAWRARRRHVTRETPLVITHPLDKQAVWLFLAQWVPDLRRVTVPGLKEWWVRPTTDASVFFHGDVVEDVALLLGAVWAAWYYQSRVKRLTWVLTPPPLIVGGLVATSRLAESAWVDSPLAVRPFFAKWRQTQEILAVADAWLWLEGEDPLLVFRWLQRFMSKEAARRWIPWLKCHPGYYVMADRVGALLTDEERTDAGDAGMWRWGPIMPDSLYLAPKELSAPTVFDISGKF